MLPTATRSCIMADYSRRQNVLQQLNSQLHSRREGMLDLGVTGSKLPLLDSKGINELKPSKIPRPLTPTRPLPATGYVSEILTTHRSTPRTSTPHSTNGKKQLKVVIHGIPQSNGSEEIHRCTQIKKTASSKTVANDHLKRGSQSVTNEAKKTTKKKKVPIESSGDSKRKKSKELRIRYIAVKYGRVWMRKVFGRVHPSAARTCHAHHLVKTVFRMWSAEWWTARREWKLNIRAECHDRYRLWQLVWAAWTQYTLGCKEKRRLRQMADGFSSKHLTRLAWHEWRVYVDVRRARGMVKRQADEWRCGSLVKCVWVRWIGAVEEVKKRQAMETLALHHWAHRLTEQVWQVWLERLHIRQVLQRHGELAIHHHSQTILLNTWAGWREYITIRQDKRAMIGIAVSVYYSKLVSRVFETWRERFERAQEITLFQELVVERGQLAVKRRAFQHWKLYISLREYKVHLLELSSQVNQLSLKRRAFHRFSMYYQQQRRKAVNRQLAASHRTKQLLFCSWSVWLRGCEHREEMKMGPQTRVAQAHFTSVVTWKVLAAWVQYTNHRRQRSQLYRVADEQFKTYALPRCFSALRVNVEVQLYKREQRETAEDFRKETVLSMVFYKWWKGAQFSQDIRMLGRVAILHDEEVKKRYLLKVWRARTRERGRHSAQEGIANTHYRHCKMSVAFCKWNSRFKALLIRREQLSLASSHYDNKSMCLVWSAWKRYIGKMRQSKERKMFANNHYKKIITHKLLQAWKTHLSLYRDKRARQLRVQGHFSAGLQGRVFSSWVVYVSEERARRELHSTAVGHFKSVTIKKCLSVWLNRTAESIDNRGREDQLVEEITYLLSRARLSRILHQWRDYSISSVAMRLAGGRADTHHSTVLKRTCFSAWWGHNRRKLRVALLTRQGEWFIRNRLLSAAYSQWRVQFMHSLVLKQASVSALWHWSEVLQRRCLASWFLHTLEGRRKRERYSQALERHRKRLVTIGVSQWIKVATQLQARREAIALQHQAKSAQSVLRCVRTCASHWLAITRRSRGSHHHKLRGHGVHSVRLVPPDSRGGGVQATGSWASLLKNLQLPDGSRTERPRPRIPSSHTTITPYITHPHTDVQPRLPLLPAPHPLSQDLHHSSFTFLTSTCSKPSNVEESATSGDTYIVDNPTPQHLETDDHHTIQTISPLVDASTRYKLQPLLFTHSDSSSSLMSDRFNSSTDSQQDVYTPVHSPSIEQPSELALLPPTLTDPSVQRELVQMRDTLKHLHQLKARQRLLERKLTSLTDEGNSEELLKVRLELSSLSQTVSSKEPLIKQCALRINELVTQTGLVS